MLTLRQVPEPPPSAADVYGARPNLLLAFGRQFRSRRHVLLLNWLDSLRLPRPYTLLDLGGTPGYWRHWGIPAGARIVCINLDPSVTSDLSEVEVVCADAACLSQYANSSVGIVFSNSLLEHLYTFERQQNMSEEIRRVGLHYFVQTPNRRFFVEPHFYRVPFWHYLPHALRLALLRRFNCGFCGPIPDRENAMDQLAEIRLCDRSDLERLFPGARLVPERVGPFIKSWMVFSG